MRHFLAFSGEFNEYVARLSQAVIWKPMGKPEPDREPLPEPFPEPEKSWPIDPRPAIRDLKELLEDSTPRRQASPQSRKWTALAVFAGFALLGWSSLSNHILHPPLPKHYVPHKQLLMIETGMTQKRVREILGEPPRKRPDCWVYDVSDEQFVEIHFGSMFKVSGIGRVKKRQRDSDRW